MSKILKPKISSVRLSFLPWLFLSCMYAPIFVNLYQIRWKLIDYSHAYFILPVSLFMTWRKRHSLKELVDRSPIQGSNGLGLGAVIFGLAMFVFGWHQDYLMIATFSMIPLLWGTIRFLYGQPVVKALSMPIFYLIFLVPPPLGILDRVTLPMRYAVSSATEFILKSFHYPITKSGLLLNIGGHELFMGAPCSGFRSLVTVLALTIAYVTLSRGDMKKKMILVACGIPLALLGNLLRIIALCLITYYVGKEAAEGVFHELSGVVIFLFIICGLMGLERLWEPKNKS